MACKGLWLGLAVSCAATAAPLPPVSDAGQNDYREYLEAPDHRAFAVAPGGAWGWRGGMPSASTAEAEALAACKAQARARCQLYAADGKVVFDAAAWAMAWRPYATAKDAAASVGRAPGQRLPNVAFTDGTGKRLNVAAFRGKVLVLHFWGTWCPPCRREMPELQRLQAAMADRRDVAFVLLQVREPYAVARRWAQAQGLQLPLFDSGSAGEDDAFLRLAGGGKLADREIARSFPTTYVIDKRGLVIFSQVGPLAAWPAYEGLLRDAADRSGR